jgi:serine/threonine protein kinase
MGYLVMELLAGRTLRSELNERERLDPRRALAILRDVASAVDAAHRQGLIHRDLKPENIFLVPHESEEVAKVLDFGLAKPIAAVDSPTVRDTSPGVLLGTPAYMAPEQLRGEDAHPSWDVWALAVVSFEMLSGRHPFAGVSAASAVPGASGYESLLSDRLESAPAEYARFFTRALAIDPAGRPASARTLLDEFERAMQFDRAISIRE